MTTTNPQHSRNVLELDAVLTIRQAAAVREKVLSALAASDRVELAIAPDTETDLSFIQLVESARIHAAMHGKELHIASPARGQVLETLRRAGLTSGMSPESRAFWLHEKESQ